MSWSKSIDYFSGADIEYNEDRDIKIFLNKLSDEDFESEEVYKKFIRLGYKWGVTIVRDENSSDSKQPIHKRFPTKKNAEDFISEYKKRYY